MECNNYTNEWRIRSCSRLNGSLPPRGGDALSDEAGSVTSLPPRGGDACTDEAGSVTVDRLTLMNARWSTARGSLRSFDCCNNSFPVTFPLPSRSSFWKNLKSSITSVHALRTLIWWCYQWWWLWAMQCMQTGMCAWWVCVSMHYYMIAGRCRG